MSITSVTVGDTVIVLVSLGVVTFVMVSVLAGAERDPVPAVRTQGAHAAQGREIQCLLDNGRRRFGT